MAGWAKDKVEDVLGGVKDKIGSGALRLLSSSVFSSTRSLHCSSSV